MLFLSNSFRRKPTNSFYVKHGVVTEDAASRFVEVARLISQGREIGDLAENLVIVNAQKFGTNSSVEWKKLNRKSYNLLIVDEAHHFPAPTWNDIVTYFNCKTIFLTATPFRKGQPILTGQNGNICYQISLNELMDRGVIRKTIFREIGTDLDSATERKTVRDIYLFISQLDFFSY
jgi:superfamily II DNA or RNA helicase